MPSAGGVFEHRFGAELDQRPHFLRRGAVALEQQEFGQAVEHHRVVAAPSLGEFQGGMLERTGEGIDAMLPAVVQPDAIHVHARLVQLRIAEKRKQRAGIFHRIVGPDARRIGQAAVVGDHALDGSRSEIPARGISAGRRPCRDRGPGFPGGPGRSMPPRPRPGAPRVRPPHPPQGPARRLDAPARWCET